MSDALPHCMNSNCPMTLGYYLGGGVYVCWLHLVAGFPYQLVRETVDNQDTVGLVPTGGLNEHRQD
ncbi:hypothetical protein LCGC14_1312430 [marine sediment metagenome]|uniref:Uncharacterized protein n=1 Tax=marine sediment metagenome TaxID=412755 RepID=A0A0F9N2U2_9ZZZZ